MIEDRKVTLEEEDQSTSNLFSETGAVKVALAVGEKAFGTNDVYSSEVAIPHRLGDRLVDRISGSIRRR